ncbi:MAG: hypothetical protein CMD06_05455 [Flavobacteriales bacterium]|nr:hypothetical protein [Flavobacteriales bacterium]
MKVCFRITFITFLLLSYYAFGQSKPIFLHESSNWVDSIMNKMSDDEKIAQLFMVAAYSNKDEIHQQKIVEVIEKYKIGGLMFLQGGPVRQAKLTNLYQKKSDIPLMIAIDAEWGVSMRLDSSVRFPWQMTLGAIEDSDLIYKMGVEIARQCKLLGIHINFAPVIDVNSNPKNPIINNRSFGEDPYRVAEKGLAYMRGMQDNHVLACAKHFPGHGDTDKDSHKTLPIINHNKDRLNKIELIPFKELINNGLGSVMTAHLNIPVLENDSNLPSSLSKNVVDSLLKNKLGFQGLCITDALNMNAVSDLYDPGDVDLKALLAGNDVLLFSENVSKAIQRIKDAIKNKIISQKDINDRCRKILLAKKWMGLDKYMPVDTESIDFKITVKETEVLNNRLIQESLTLLQNYNDLLPLKRLDTLKIASVIIGENAESFQKTLSLYAPIDFFHISSKASLNEQAVLLSKLEKYNLVIASVHKSNLNAWKPYNISQNIDVLLQSIALSNRLVLSIFANPYSLNSLLFSNNFDALTLSYQNSTIAQEKTAQAIFGGIGFRGTLPVNTKHFNINTGINTSSIRMSYVFPEEIGLSSKFIFKIDSIVDNAIKEKAMPGCQILIAKEGNIFFNKSYGYHTYDNKKKVMNSDVYDLASITKIAATLPILMLMSDKKEIKLKDKISSHLSVDLNNKKNLTFKDILAHQAKLTPWIPFYKSTLDKDTLTGLMKLRDTLYSNIKNQDFPHHVADNIYLHHSYTDSINLKIYNSDLLDKKEYVYSDLGFYLFKQIIEEKYEDKLNNIINKEFYSKLGMENLGYLPLNRVDIKRIVPTENDFEFRSQVLRGYVHDMGAAMQGGVGGHAGLFSNANDLAKIMQMYLQKGEYGAEIFLSDKVVNEFIKCHFCRNENRRGLGFDKPALEGQEGGPTCNCISLLSFGHTGFTGTLAWADPKSQIVYIFLSNRIHPDASNKKLLDMNVRTEIMQVIYDNINEE